MCSFLVLKCFHRILNKHGLKWSQDVLCGKRQKNKYNQKLVQDVLYLIQGMTILSSTLSMIPITSCGRLPFPVHCIHYFHAPAKKHCNSYPEMFNFVHDRIPFVCSTRKNWHVFTFIRLHGWIKLCKTVNKIIFFLLYVTKDMFHTKCTDTINKWDKNTECTHWGVVSLRATDSCLHQGQLTLSHCIIYQDRHWSSPVQKCENKRVISPLQLERGVLNGAM